MCTCVCDHFFIKKNAISYICYKSIISTTYICEAWIDSPMCKDNLVFKKSTWRSCRCCSTIRVQLHVRGFGTVSCRYTTRTTYSFFLPRERSRTHGWIYEVSSDPRIAKTLRLSCQWGEVKDAERVSKCTRINIKLLLVFFFVIILLKKNG